MVEFITFKKEKYPIRLSYRAIKALKAHDGFDVVAFSKGDFDFGILEVLLWQGLVSGHKSEEKELTLSQDQMEDVLDECWTDFIKLIPKFFNQIKVKAGEDKKGNEQSESSQEENKQNP